MNGHLSTLIALASAFCLQNHLDAGLEAYRNKDYEGALRILLPLAEQGDAKSQMTIADMYFAGNGVTRSVPAYLRWYEAAANNGNAIAMANLGVFYYTDQQVPDQEKAEYWLEKSAATGNGQSMALLAVLTLERRGDLAGYESWLHKSADAGYEDAYLNLMNGYLNGKILNKDYAKGRLWAEKSAERGFKQGDVWLGFIFQLGWGVDIDLPKSVVHFERAARAGDATAQFEFGKMTYLGLGTRMDRDAAIPWLVRAAKGGKLHAMIILSDALWHGSGVPADRIKSLVLMRFLVLRIDNAELKEKLSMMDRELTAEQRIEAVKMYDGILRNELPFDSLLPPIRD